MEPMSRQKTLAIKPPMINGVFIKQAPFQAMDGGSWIQISTRWAKKLGMPEWMVFKFKPVDGNGTALSPGG
jgi:hypothetical protein